MSSQPSPKPALPLAQYTIGWISALPLEAAAACEMLDEEHTAPAPDPNDPTSYTLGRMCGHAVVIGCLPAGRIGTTPAAVIASRMVAKFTSIRFGLMVGIGGGNPSKEDIRLGDVVVSQPQGRYGGVAQYNMGKETLEGFQETGQLNAPPEILLSALSEAQKNFYRGRSRYMEYLSEMEEKNPRFSRSKAGPDILYRFVSGCEAEEAVDREERDEDELVQIHFGNIASDNKVIKNAMVRNEISKRLGGILCFEMEAAGLMNTFPCLVVRGICDYADSKKNKKWQPYASATAATYAKEILSVIPPRDVVDLVTIKGTLCVEAFPLR